MYNDLTLEQAFYIIFIISYLGSPLKMFVFGIYNYYSSSVISDRIFKLNEIPDENEDLDRNDESLKNGTIVVENGDFSYFDKKSLDLFS